MESSALRKYENGGRQPAHCAGVLPYCTIGGRVYFLLGKSRAGHKLTTFTGKQSGENERVEETAAREFAEESLSVMLSRDEAYESIKECPPTHIIKSKSPRGHNCTTFLIQVPFSRIYPQVFERVRGLLLSQNLLPWHLAEMSQIVMVSAQVMLQTVRAAWQTSGLINTEDQWKVIELVCASALTLSRPLLLEGVPKSDPEE